MDFELLLVLGLVLIGLAIPSMISTFSENRKPRLSALIALIAAGMIGWAVLKIPGGVGLRQIPDIIIHVIARYVFWP